MNYHINGFKITLLYFFIFFSALNSFAQNYGLGISAQEVYKETSTSLNLTPDKSICLNGDFELSFDVSLMRLQKAFFGYIFRIVDDDDRNFDLIYNAQVSDHPFSVVVGDYQTKIKFNIPLNDFSNKWNRIRIKFNVESNEITVSYGSKVYTQHNLHLKKKGCYRIFYGTNHYKQFITNDALPIKLRNVRISQNRITKYHWPLDEFSGATVHELINGSNGTVKNPLWMASMHYKWEKVSDFVVKGAASSAFDNKKELLFIIGEDSLFTYNVATSRLSAKPNKRKFLLNHGNQSIYNSIDSNIYNMLPDLKTGAKRNVSNEDWDIVLPHWQATDFWHSNKVISRKDSSVYFFGGYGNLKYKNTVQRFSLKTKQWELVKPKGDFFTPRYLSGSGSNLSGDTIYILGGYGNANGSQMISPKNIYGMMRFTPQDKTFKKLFDLKKGTEDFSFANSLIINDQSKTYYGLVFPQHKYKSNLRLLFGSLNDGRHKVMGSPILYDFSDIRSYADLFYCPLSKQFVAITLLRSDEERTKVTIYTLQGPPYELPDRPPYHQGNKSGLLMGLLFLIGLTLDGLLLYFNRKSKLLSVNTEPEPVEPDLKTRTININSVFLFGDLQVFNNDGVDITDYFSPLLKELFLLLLTYSIKNGRGLSAQKLDEILWFGKSERSVSNNRSVNIAKLKTILKQIRSCEVVKESGYWKLDFNDKEFYVDYQEYIRLMQDKKKLGEQEIRKLLTLTKRGNFLANQEYEWLDQFKSEISDKVISELFNYANFRQPYHAEFNIEISNFIFYFDPVNEDAMILKCQALSYLGKHSLAKKTFDTFVKDYKSIYNENFKKDFNEVIKK